MRRQWLFLLSGASFSTTSHITLAGVDVSVLLEAANHLLGLLDEVGYHLLVVLVVLAFFEDREHPSSVRLIALLPSFGSR